MGGGWRGIIGFLVSFGVVGIRRLYIGVSYFFFMYEGWDGVRRS